MLDETVNALVSEMQLLMADNEHRALAYVQQKDLRNLPIFEDMTVIAVRAPPGTRMEVPDPLETPEGLRYQVFLRTANESAGPVNFYLVSKAADVLGEEVVQQPDAQAMAHAQALVMAQAGAGGAAGAPEEQGGAGEGGAGS